MSDFRLYAQDGECVRTFAEAHRHVPHWVPATAILPTSVQGFALCDTASRAPVAGVHAFPYRARRLVRRRVLHLTRFVSIPWEAPPPRAAAALLAAMETVAARAGAAEIEAEVYRGIAEDVYFPSGGTAVATWNVPEWIVALTRAGFASGPRTLTFALPDLDAGAPGGAVEVHALRGDDASAEARYYALWTASGRCPYDLAHTGRWHANAFGWPRAWYAELPGALARPDTILFARRRGRDVGLVHWWPNVFPAVVERGRAGLGDPPGRIGEGKVFKLVTTAQGDEAAAVEDTLLAGALAAMRDAGIRRCHVGGVPAGGPLAARLAARGGRIVQELWTMRRRLSWFTPST